MGNITESESLFLKKSGNLLVIILLAVPMLVGVVLLIASAKNILSVEVKEIKNFSYDSLEDGEVYYFDELIIVDRYATTKNERVNTKTGQTVSVDYDDAYIAGFVDKDGQWVYVDLSMGRYTDLGQKCDDYAEDDTRKLGDLVISGCFKGYDQEDEEPSGYFGIAYELCNAELPGEVLVWDFSYQNAETIEDYREDKVGDATSSIMFGLFMMIPCTIGIFIFVGKRKNLMPDGYIERLQKYAVRYLPENMNDIHTQRAMLDTVRRVFPIEEKMIPAIQKVFESGTFGDMSAMQFHGQIAASVERWCGTFKEKEILTKVKNMETEQVLPAWIIMDFYCAILEEERKYNLNNYRERIAKAIYKKGFVIPEVQAVETERREPVKSQESKVMQSESLMQQDKTNDKVLKEVVSLFSTPERREAMIANHDEEFIVLYRVGDNGYILDFVPDKGFLVGGEHRIDLPDGFFVNGTVSDLINIVESNFDKKKFPWLYKKNWWENEELQLIFLE